MLLFYACPTFSKTHAFRALQDRHGRLKKFAGSGFALWVTANAVSCILFNRYIMRYSLFLFALLSFGCGKEAPEAGNGTRLQAINVEGKIHQSFEYDGGLLVKENLWYGCEQTPMDEYFYVYTGSRLDTAKALLRSLSSSSSAFCNPAYNLFSYAVPEYDNQNRFSKITQPGGSVRTLEYNAANFIVKQIITHPAADSFVLNYKRNAVGNLIEETTSRGDKKLYQYDNNKNPYYLIKQRPDIVTAFNSSPNNVVKISEGSNVHEIRYEYNSRGLPVKMFDNGSTYEFIYQ